MGVGPAGVAQRVQVGRAPSRSGEAGGKTAPDALAPSNPDFKADQQPERSAELAVPPPLPPVVWDVASAQELLAYIERIGVEGLNPADYDPAGLQAAIQPATRRSSRLWRRSGSTSLLGPRPRPCEEAGADRLVGRRP